MKKYRCNICNEEVGMTKLFEGKATCSCGNITLKFNGLWGFKIIYKDGNKVDVFLKNEWKSNRFFNIKSKKWKVTYSGDSAFTRYEMHQTIIEFDKELYQYEVEEKMIHNEKFSVNGEFYFILEPIEEED